MILKKILPNYYSIRANKTFSAPFGIDDPKTAFRSAEEWHTYPIDDFVYSFNSWAFRGHDYERYLGKPVNICLGDSFTLNIGGPLEHSWASQLAENFDIPTLNFGVDGAGNDTIRMIYEYLLTVFDVQNTFVMYSFFHRRYNSFDKFLLQDVFSDKENFDFFEQNKIDSVYYTFLPPWCWSDSEKAYIDQFHKNHLLDYTLNDVEHLDKNRQMHATLERYTNLAGTDWPTFKDFIAECKLKDDIHHEIFVKRSKDLFLPANRDGYHLNYVGNKMVCDYFLSQVNRTHNV